MALDGLVISNLVYELNQKILDARISKIAQPESDELLLTLKGKSGQERLAVSASASLPLMYLTAQNKPGPLTAPNFCMLLRKHIANGRIVSITQPGLERIVIFEIEHLDELGDRRKKKLIVELMGKHSNIIFCDESDRIIDSIKHISAQVSSVREVLPGRTWFIPQTQKKENPLVCCREEFVSAMEHAPQPAAKAIYMNFTGISPLLANEMCWRAGLDGDTPTAAYDRAQLEQLYVSFSGVLSAVSSGTYHPCMLKRGEEPVEFASVALTSFPELDCVEYESVCSLLEDYYAEKERYTRIRQKSADLRRIVNTALERSRKKYQLQEKQLLDTEKREKYRIYGEMLHTYGYNLEPDAKFMECINYYTDEPMKVPLDPNLTASENAKKYFDRYGKLKRTYEALSERIVETKEDITYLESVSNAIDLAVTEADLSQIREELVQSGYIRRRQTKKKSSAKSRPWHYRTADGYDIYVGRNNLQNDELTFRLAEGNDWWFHAKKMPGSHVIVKTKSGELPDAVFEQAAAAAAYYSGGRGSDKVEIDYLQKKNVKKPNRAKPGFVIYYTNYSMTIAPDISALTLI